MYKYRGIHLDRRHTPTVKMDADYIKKILSFNHPKELKEWAIIHNKLFDVDVRNRLMQLEKSIKVCGKKVSLLFTTCYCLQTLLKLINFSWFDRNLNTSGLNVSQEFIHFHKVCV